MFWRTEANSPHTCTYDVTVWLSRTTDNSNIFIRSREVRDNESRLYLAEKVKMPRTTKGHNYINFSWNSLKNKPGNLHIIPNQHIIFQDPSLSAFREILLTRSK